MGKNNKLIEEEYEKVLFFFYFVRMKKSLIKTSLYFTMKSKCMEVSEWRKNVARYVDKIIIVG